MNFKWTLLSLIFNKIVLYDIENTIIPIPTHITQRRKNKELILALYKSMMGDQKRNKKNSVYLHYMLNKLV